MPPTGILDKQQLSMHASLPRFFHFPILPQLLVISQSDRLISHCWWESRQRFLRYARVNVSPNVTANQECLFWEIKQSYSKNVIGNVCSFFVSWSWSRSEINIFFGLNIVVKNKSNMLQRCLYPYWQRYSLSLWSKCCASWVRNILITMMMDIIVNMSTDNAKPCSRLLFFFNNHNLY